MEQSKQSKKEVKRNRPTQKRQTESNKIIPDTKSKMRGESKQATLIEMLARPGGVTIDEMAKATGWQRHSVRPSERRPRQTGYTFQGPWSERRLFTLTRDTL
jgi:3-deoxy-D-arabino-heptulosonate 7-phosphate (DAHP) synthase